MPSLFSFSTIFSLSVSFLLTLPISLSIPPSKKTFIVLVDFDSKPSPFVSHLLWYSSLLSSSSSSSAPNASPFIHIHNSLFHGFSASLAHNQSEHLKRSRGVLAVFPDVILQLHTTRSPGFLGLEYPNSLISRLSNGGDDTIIGIVDTGIWPERRSFCDHGISPVPSRWRGKCMEGNRFDRSNCNRKLIGARFFVGGYDASPVGPINETTEFRSPRDSNGHGTHIASIAAGAHVARAGFQGFAEGIARGMAPKARIAVYKVCWDLGCLLSDVCKAMEEAVSDGVDIISVSLGSSTAPFYQDLFAIASFRAFQNGVFIAISAGNEGPYQASIANSPPWILTVGAGTIDRDFLAVVSIGNGMNIHGTSLTPRNKLTHKPHPLVKISSPLSKFSPQSLYGKIVLFVAERHAKRIAFGSVLKRAGAVAMIISHGDLDPKGIIAESHVIPAIAVSMTEAKSIEDYIECADDPTAIIVPDDHKRRLHVVPAPTVASFSSRGPNMALPSFLKPDLLAPGVNILGAWTDEIALSNAAFLIQPSQFNILSGTSMACPHASGVATLIKTAHPDWSPSDIKSALMTTASPCQNAAPFAAITDESTGNAASPFDIGAGHLHPVRAVDPGLVYDVGPDDYVNFLCGLNYTMEQMQIVTGKRVPCTKESKRWVLNYPAFVAVAEEFGVAGVVFERRLKKVSRDDGVVYYKAKVVGLEGFRVWVRPKMMRFGGGPGESLKFTFGVGPMKRVMDGGDEIETRGLAHGALIWKEVGGKHAVRSPVVVFSKKQFKFFEKKV